MAGSADFNAGWRSGQDAAREELHVEMHMLRCLVARSARSAKNRTRMRTPDDWRKIRERAYIIKCASSRPPSREWPPHALQAVARVMIDAHTKGVVSYRLLARDVLNAAIDSGAVVRAPHDKRNAR